MTTPDQGLQGSLVPDQGPLVPNLYVPVDVRGGGAYRVNSTSPWYLPLGRVLRGWNTEEIGEKLRYLYPIYAYTYLNTPFNRAMLPVWSLYLQDDRRYLARLQSVRTEFFDPAEEGNASLVKLEADDFLEEWVIRYPNQGEWSFEMILRLAQLGEYDTIWYIQERWIYSTRDAPETVALTVNEEYKYDLLIRAPILNLLAQRNGVNNLMILTSRGWDLYLEKALDATPVSAKELSRALPYALPYPDLYAFLLSRGATEVSEMPQYREQLYQEKSYRKSAQFEMIHGERQWLNLDSSLVQLPGDPAYYDASGRAYSLVPSSAPLIFSYPNCDSAFVCTYEAFSGMALQEYITGSPISTLYAGQFRKIQQLAIEVCSALQRLHSRGFVLSSFDLSQVMEVKEGQYKLFGLDQAEVATTEKIRREIRIVGNRFLQTYGLNANNALTQIFTLMQEGKLRSMEEVIRSLQGLARDYWTVAWFEEREGKKHLLNVGEVFRKIRQLGKGGFGVVNLVEDLEGKQYALKKEKSKNKKPLPEDTIIPRISKYPNCNPDLICVIDTFYYQGNWGQYRGILYEYIKGQSLKELVNSLEMGATLSFPGLFLWLARTVQALHEQNIVHHDISPGNVMVTKEGSYKLIDFGLACVIPDCLHQAGTKKYMAPELFLKNKQIDYRRTDDYSIGAVMKYVLKRSPGSSRDLLERKVAQQLTRTKVEDRLPLPEAIRLLQ